MQDPPVDAVTAAAYIRHLTGRPCSPITIRYWAHRGWIHRVGRRGRCTLYDLDELHQHVTGAALPTTL